MHGGIFTLLSIIFYLNSAQAQQIIDTVAGGAIRFGVPAQQVALGSIAGAAVDGEGNLIFCESSSNSIRRIRKDGIIETIAGTGVSGYGGDGGPAVRALLNSPASPGLDAVGNLYFIDAANYRIRRIDTAGVITTVAGTGIPATPGIDLEGAAASLPIFPTRDLAVDASGNVYFSEAGAARIRRLTPSGRVERFAGVEFDLNSDLRPPEGDGGPALQAWLDTPIHLAIDPSGNLYFNEGILGRHIRRISTDGIVSRFAGYGFGNGPNVDLPADTGNDGPALKAAFVGVEGLAATSSGLYVADFDPNFDPYIGAQNGLLRLIDSAGIIRGAAGGGTGGDGPPGQVQFNIPTAIAADVNGVYIAERLAFSAKSGRLRILTPQSGVQTIAAASPAPAPDGTPPREAWFLRPSALAFARNGDLYIAEQGACLVRRLTLGGALTTFAGTGRCGTTAPAGSAKTADLLPPIGIAVDSQNRVYVQDSQNSVYMISPEGSITALSVTASKIAIDSRDRLVFASGPTVFRLPTSASPQPFAMLPSNVSALAVDASDNVFVIVSSGLMRISSFGAASSYGSHFGNALAVDSAGTAWLAGGSSLSKVASPNDPYFFIQNPGFPAGGFCGDSGPVAAACFNEITALAFASNGDLYVADQTNRIRKISGSPTKNRPSISQGGVVNAASLAAGPIALGELVSIFGSNFAPTGLQTFTLTNNSIPTLLGNVRVEFGGTALLGAITAVTPNQINVFVPYILDLYLPGSSSIPIVVRVDDIASAPVTVPIANVAFGLSAVNASGSGQGAILNQDGSLNGSTNPATRGSIVTLYGTGEGVTSPALPDGALVLSTPFPKPKAGPVSVMIGGQPGEVLYAGGAPFLPTGVLQINVRIPASAALGDTPVIVTIGGVSTTRRVTVAVK
jgi:uncharacterized protein (TIGR03437 family)